MKTALKIMVAGEEYPVEMTDEGVFFVSLDTPGDDHGVNQIRASSFAELERKARKIKVKFEFPFSRIESNGTVRHGTVTGLHATNGNILVRWASGKTEQLPSWSGHGDVMQRLDEPHTIEVERLVAARRKAQRELDNYLAPLKLTSLKKAAEQARDKAVKESK